VLPLDAASLGLAGLGVASLGVGLGVAGLGVASLGVGLGVASLGVASLGVAQKITPLHRCTPSPSAPLHRQRPLTVAVAPLQRRTPSPSAPLSPSHHSAADPQTPQTPQPPLKAANISKRPQSNSKKPPHRIGRHQIDIDKRGWPIRKS
jgi:hypothetical protein